MELTEPRARPAWVEDADELPHEPGDVPLWCENYLTYVHDPEREVCAWMHLCHRPADPSLWQETLLISLPEDRFLAAKAIAPGEVGRGVNVCGASYVCERPFTEWTKRFEGGARLVRGDQLRAGPLDDGAHVPVELELSCRSLGPAYDFGAEHLEQEWGHGHYEGHQQVSGSLAYGDERLEISGTGLRDHSWGPRDYNRIGSTTWIHGQFPSGRTFMVVLVTGTPPAEPFTYAVISDGQTITPVEASGIPTATDASQAGHGYELMLETPDGPSTIRAEVLTTMPMSFLGPAEIGIGLHAAPAANHHYIEGPSRFEWDGEIGHGITERSVALGD
jgi:hypothetical protein